MQCFTYINEALADLNSLSIRTPEYIHIEHAGLKANHVLLEGFVTFLHTRDDRLALSVLQRAQIDWSVCP